MSTKRDIVALAVVLLILLFLLIHRANAGAQDQARADIQNAEGKSIGSGSLRETKDGVASPMTIWPISFKVTSIFKQSG